MISAQQDLDSSKSCPPFLFIKTPKTKIAQKLALIKSPQKTTGIFKKSSKVFFLNGGFPKEGVLTFGKNSQINLYFFCRRTLAPSILCATSVSNYQPTIFQHICLVNSCVICSPGTGLVWGCI